MSSLTVFIGIAVVLLIIAGVMAIGVTTWNSTVPSMTSDGYIWTIGNGEDIFQTSGSIMYPYVKTASQVTITFTLMIPVSSPTHPSLPILISLPIPASSLIGDVFFSSHVLPLGQTSIQPVLYDANHIALQYQPSGLLATGAELTTSWTLMFQVIYNIA